MPKILDFEDHLGLPPPKGKKAHAKFHDNRLHRRRDPYPDKKIHTKSDKRILALRVLNNNGCIKHGRDDYALSTCSSNTDVVLLWTPAQRKRASMLYFANVFFYYFFMAALFSGPGERRFAKVLHVVDLECH